MVPDSLRPTLMKIGGLVPGKVPVTERLFATPTNFVKVVSQSVHPSLSITTQIAYDAHYVRKMNLHPDINQEDAAHLDRHVFMNFAIGGVLEPGLWREVEDYENAKFAD